MRLVAYLRLSSDSQLDAWGIDRQRDAIQRWAERHDHELVAEHSDVVTGKADAADRPGLTDALGMLRAPRTADGIVASHLDRFARQLTTQEAILALAWGEGATVFTADTGEVLRDDPDDPMRTAMRQVQGVFAQLERATLVKRMRDGQRAKAATGRKATGSYAFGLQGTGEGRERDAGPRADEQPAVAVIAERRRAGDSYRAIAGQLDALGLRPRRAASWSAMSVRAVAQRVGVA